MKTHLDTYPKNTQKLQDFFVSERIKKSGYLNIVKNGEILILSKISDSDLEEIEFVYDEYNVKVSNCKTK